MSANGVLQLDVIWRNNVFKNAEVINIIKGEQILLLQIIKLLSILIEKLPKLFNTENGKHDIAKIFWTRAFIPGFSLFGE